MKRRMPYLAPHPSTRPKPGEQEDDQSPADEEPAGPASAGPPPGAEEEEDELDRLLNQYQAQAAEDLQRTQRAEAARAAPGKPRSAAARREAALEQPLAEDNKGFRMLAAMGYQPGRGIGKSVEGRAEPIPLDVKQDKLGLGRVNKKAAAREAQRQREREAAARTERAQHAATASIHAGRQRTAEQFAARREASQLRKAQQVCEALDTAAGITTNYLWQPPPEDEHLAMGGASGSSGHPGAAPLPGRSQRPLTEGGRGGAAAGLGGLVGAAGDELLEEGDFFRRDLTGPGQEEDEDAEQRRYAGAAATARAAAGRGPGPAGDGAGAVGWGSGGQEPIPGPAALAAAAGPQPPGNRQPPEGGGTAAAPQEAVAAAAAAAAAWHALPARQRLEDVLRYLRQEYCYCLFCGCRFSDREDLYEHCPGLLEADHE